MFRRFLRLLAATAIASVALALSPAMAADGNILITDAFARAAPIGGIGAVFLTIVSTGLADRLVGAATPAAAKAELHESMDDDGVMRMRPVAGLDVPAGASVKLAPGGYHLMLTGLKQSLIVGGQLPVTLIFEHAGKIHATASVVRPGGVLDSPMGPGMNHDMTRLPSTARMK